MNYIYQDKTGYSWERAKTWWSSRRALRDFIAKSRVGVYGPRPFGSRAKVVELSRKATGARLRKEATARQQPLSGVFDKVKSWLEKERSHGHEVRTKHVIQRIKYQMEHERDRQQVLLEVGDKRYDEVIFQTCEDKLSWFQAIVVIVAVVVAVIVLVVAAAAAVVVVVVVSSSSN